MEVTPTSTTKESSDLSFNTWLQRVRRSGHLSDINVLVHGHSFALHSLPLLNASSYFRALANTTSANDNDNASGGDNIVLRLPRVVEIVDPSVDDHDAFSMAMDFCYLIRPTYSCHNVGPIRAVGEFLGMPDLVEDTKKYLYGNVFGHWKLAVDFLCKYQRVGVVCVNEYIESRCVIAIVNGCTKAFVETRQLSAPIAWKTSPAPSERLAHKLASIANLPDRYVQDVIDAFVKCHLNLNIKCRQGRYVKEWIDHLISESCKSSRSKLWVIVCLSRMLQKTCSADPPWLELSSCYWCTLLEHADILVESGTLEEEMQEKLVNVKAFLEYRIGRGLDELDWYLNSYNLTPQTMLNLVSHFKEKEVEDYEKKEVCMEVDSCLWNFAECGSILPSTFASLYESFPHSFRQNHDSLYNAIERLVEKHRLDVEQAQVLWRLVDPSKLSSPVYDKALKNPAFLCQPQILETVLQRYNQELEQIGDGDDSIEKGRERQNLKQIMHKVIKASLKLLEENSRRSREIIELQKQYAALLQERISAPRDSFESNPELFFSHGIEAIKDT